MTNLPVPRTTNFAAAVTGDYQADLDLGAKLREAAESLQFMLGDWVAAMEEKHGESVASLAKDMSTVTGVNANTLREYARVAKAFPPAERSAQLTYGHHLRASVAPDPVKVLKQAAEEGLSVRDTERLAKGLPTGGDEVAKQTTSEAGAVNLEEMVMSDLAAAVQYVRRAEQTIRKPGFRLTVPVAQGIMGGLEALATPFKAIEAACVEEAGEYVR